MIFEFPWERVESIIAYTGSGNAHKPDKGSPSLLFCRDTNGLTYLMSSRFDPRAKTHVVYAKGYAIKDNPRPTKQKITYRFALRRFLDHPTDVPLRIATLGNGRVRILGVANESLSELRKASR